MFEDACEDIRLRRKTEQAGTMQEYISFEKWELFFNLKCALSRVSEGTEELLCNSQPILCYHSRLTQEREKDVNS